MSGRVGKGLVFLAAGAVSWYTGVKFWQPIIIEQLRKDGNLRDDVYIPPDTAPQSWEDIRKKVQEALDPNKEQEFKEAEKQVRDGSSSS